MSWVFDGMEWVVFTPTCLSPLNHSLLPRDFHLISLKFGFDYLFLCASACLCVCVRAHVYFSISRVTTREVRVVHLPHSTSIDISSPFIFMSMQSFTFQTTRVGVCACLPWCPAQSLSPTASSVYRRRQRALSTCDRYRAMTYDGCASTCRGRRFPMSRAATVGGVNYFVIFSPLRNSCFRTRTDGSDNHFVAFFHREMKGLNRTWGLGG